MPNLEFAVFDEGGYNFFSGVDKAADLYDDLLNEVVLEEELGFDYHFIIEHQGHAVGQIQTPSVYLSAIAQRTKKIRFGAMVFLLPFYNPLRLAMECAMIDQLSHGRLEFGAGVGGSPDTFEAWHVPFSVSDRRKAGVEALEVIETAWAQEKFSYDGDFYKFSNVVALPRPYQNPHPRIWFAGRTKASLELCVRKKYGVGAFLTPDDDIVRTFNLWRDLWDQSGQTGPRPPAFLSRAVYVAETDEQALEEAAKYLPQAYCWGEERHDVVSVGGDKFVAKNEAQDPERVLATKMFAGMRTGMDFWLEHNLAYVGSPETVARKIADAKELIGFDVFGGRFRFGAMPQNLLLDSLRRFGEQVIPALRSQQSKV